MTITKNSYQNLLKIEDSMNRKKNQNIQDVFKTFTTTKKEKQYQNTFTHQNQTICITKEGKKAPKIIRIKKNHDTTYLNC